MLTVSDAFKLAAWQPVRRVYTRVTCTFLDNIHLGDYVDVTCSGGEKDSLVAADNLINGVSEAQHPWALARTDCYPGDSTYPVDEGYEIGWMSAALSDGSAVVNPAEEVLLEFADVETVGSFRVFGDSWLGYAVDFQVHYWDGNQWVLAANVTGNSDTQWSFDLSTPVATTKARLTITKISRASDHVALLEFVAGLIVDLTPYVRNWSVVKERYYDQAGSLPIGNYSAGELQLVLDNTDNRFFVDDADSPYFGYLKSNRRLQVEVGLKKADTNIEYCAVGTYYTVTWKASTSGADCAVTARDRSKLLQSQVVELAVQEDLTISELAALVADAAGIAGCERDIDATVETIPFGVFEPKPAWEHLRDLAVGEAGYMWVDEDNWLRFESRGHLEALDMVLATLDDASYIVALDSGWDEGLMRNKVRVISKRLKRGVESTIWSLQESVEVPGSGTGWWNTDYGKRRRLTVTAAAGVENDIDTGNCLKLEITGDDAAEIYSHCLSSGKDLRMIYRMPTTHEIDRYITELSSSKIVIYFAAGDDIAAEGSDPEYMLYYGNPGAGDPPDDGAAIFDIWDDFDDNALDPNWVAEGGGVWTEADGLLKFSSYGLAPLGRVLYNDQRDDTDWELGVKGKFFDLRQNREMGLAIDNMIGSGGNQYGGYVKQRIAYAEITTPAGTTTEAYEVSSVDWNLYVLRKQGINKYLEFNGVQIVHDTSGFWEAEYFGVQARSVVAAGGGLANSFNEFWYRAMKTIEPTLALDDVEEKPLSMTEPTEVTLRVRFQGPAVEIAEPVITEGGADVSVKEYTYYSTGGVIVLTNVGPDTTLTGMTIAGKLLEEDGQFEAEAVDDRLVAEYGERRQEVDNAFIQSLAQAESYAGDLLEQYRNSARQIVVKMPNRGQPHFQLGDRLAVENEVSGMDAEFWIVRSRLEFDGGLHGELTLLEAA